PVRASTKESGKDAEGKLAVIDNRVDPSTGMIRLKAVFENQDHLLWPGQFVNIVMTLDSRSATVVPSEAVQAGQQGQCVYVVKSDQTGGSRPVTVGATSGGQIVSVKGVAAGETVVTEGQSRLYPGAHIQTSSEAK